MSSFFPNNWKTIEHRSVLVKHAKTLRLVFTHIFHITFFYHFQLSLKPISTFLTHQWLRCCKRSRLGSLRTPLCLLHTWTSVSFTNYPIFSLLFLPAASKRQTRLASNDTSNVKKKWTSVLNVDQLLEVVGRMGSCFRKVARVAFFVLMNREEQ